MVATKLGKKSRAQDYNASLDLRSTLTKDGKFSI